MALLLSVVLLGCFSGICVCSEGLQTDDGELSLRELVLELQKTISHQNNRIASLEDRTRELQNVNDNQSRDIDVLKKKIENQEEKNLNLIKMQSVCEENVRKIDRLFDFTKPLVEGQSSNLNTSSVYPTVTSKPQSPPLFRKGNIIIFTMNIQGVRIQNY
jgi:hypothetical protein